MVLTKTETDTKKEASILWTIRVGFIDCLEKWQQESSLKLKDLKKLDLKKK